jgi:hypothetical protein|tara:strand:- start:294 stop:626 length:333 start_codon:yes stop_codon:yes gene_type:complete
MHLADKFSSKKHRASSLKKQKQRAQTSKNFFLHTIIVFKGRRRLRVTLCSCAKALIRVLYLYKHILFLERERECFILSHQQHNNTNNKEPNHHHRALESQESAKRGEVLV